MLKLWLHVETVEGDGELAGAWGEPVELVLLEDDGCIDEMVDQLVELCCRLRERKGPAGVDEGHGTPERPGTAES